MKKVLALFTAAGLLLCSTACSSSKYGTRNEHDDNKTSSLHTQSYASIEVMSESESESAAKNDTDSLESQLAERFDEDCGVLKIYNDLGQDGDNVSLAVFENNHLYFYGSGKTKDYVTVSEEPQKTSARTSQIYSDYYAAVTDVFVTEGITELGSGAFYGFEKLSNVEIANSVTKIGDCAFTSCKKLKNIQIPDTVNELGIEVFKDCESLESVTLSDSISAIKREAFSGCKSLKKIELPSAASRIGYKAFSDCSSLDTIVFTGDRPEIDDTAFFDIKANVYIPDNNDTWSNAAEDFDVDNRWHGGEITLMKYDPSKGIDTAEPFAAEQTADWRAIYREQLNTENSMGYRFGLIYIDEDDIPELIIADAVLTGTGNIYTVYNNELCDVGRINANSTLYFKEKGNLMMAGGQKMGITSYGFTSIIEGKREYVHTFSDTSLTGKSPIVYKFDDREVTKEEYDSNLNKYQQGMSTYDFSNMPEINEANVNNLLG